MYILSYMAARLRKARDEYSWIFHLGFYDEFWPVDFPVLALNLRTDRFIR